MHFFPWLDIAILAAALAVWSIDHRARSAMLLTAAALCLIELHHLPLLRSAPELVAVWSMLAGGWLMTALALWTAARFAARRYIEGDIFRSKTLFSPVGGAGFAAVPAVTITRSSNASALVALLVFVGLRGAWALGIAINMLLGAATS